MQGGDWTAFYRKCKRGTMSESNVELAMFARANITAAN